MPWAPDSSEQMATDGAKIFSGGGEIGALIRENDWSRTTRGAIDDWPPSLLTSILGAKPQYAGFVDLDAQHTTAAIESARAHREER